MGTVVVDPREAVVNVLRKGPQGPADLMVLIKQDTQFDDLTIKDAVSELLDERVIEFSSERKLRLRVAQQKVS